jgi:uncharacterized GH25 family protein
VVRLGSRWALAAALWATTGPYARAHNFWIEPATYEPDIGQVVAVGLDVGDYLQSWPLPRNDSRIEKFASIGPDGEHAIVGRDGTDPAGVVRFMQPGPYILVYRSNRAFTAMEPAKFDEYLEEKGLHEILALRHAQPAIDGKVLEAYSRYSKSLVRAGGAGLKGADHVIGLRFEIVADAQPQGKSDAVGQSFHVIFDGKPLSGALVTAMRRNAPSSKIQARTDARGQVTLDTNTPGVWLIAAVKMLPAPPQLAAQWESFWASLTYEAPARQ